MNTPNRPESSGPDRCLAGIQREKQGRNGEAEKAVAAGLMLILEEIGKQKSQGLSAKAPSVQDLVKQLQNYITEHYYQCTPEILSGLEKCTQTAEILR